MALFPDAGGPDSGTASRAPRFPVYIDDGEVRLVTDLREATWTETLRVSDAPDGRFVGLADALDHAPSVREGMLSLSPDPTLERWRRYRAAALAAPVAWSVFVVGELRQTSDLARDARRVTQSPEFKAAERDPETATATLARHERIDRAIAMRWTYGIVEAAIGLCAALVVISGLRRLRALTAAVGFGAGLWWLFHAGQPDRCFGPRAFRELLLAALGLGGAVTVIALAPSETTVVTRLRARLGFASRAVVVGPGDRDLIAMLAAVWAGLLLPFLLRWLAGFGLHDLSRAMFFVLFCSLAFFGFLAWRKEESRVAPRLGALALSAALGFGVTTACDVAARATLATVIEAQTCISPSSASKLKSVQEKSAKETTAARKETQSQALAFWIAVLAAPIAEEMLYRGTLQRVARRRIGSRGSMLLSAGVFGVAHALAFPAAFYQHFGLGLAFAAVFEIAGGGAVGILASAATHAMWNGWLATMPVF
jgi:membrane protease YdiL (CAAX protease family)